MKHEKMIQVTLTEKDILEAVANMIQLRLNRDVGSALAPIVGPADLKIQQTANGFEVTYVISTETVSS